MSLADEIVALQRRVERLEANRGCSVRFGIVTESNTEGSARVQLLDGDNMVSMPVRTLQKRTLQDQEQCLPDIGEQVAVLFSGQGLEEGCILGAIYSAKDKSPAQEQHIKSYTFSDGSTFFYDREEHKLFAHIKGDAEITIDKNATISIVGNVTANINGNLTASTTGNATIESQKELKLHAHTYLALQGDKGMSITTPAITSHNLDGADTPCTMELHADLTHTGKVTHTGKTTQNGSVTVNGDSYHRGNITSSENIAAAGTVTGNPVYGCRH